MIPNNHDIRNCDNRTKLAEFLKTRDRGGWDWEDIAKMTDAQMRRAASERHQNVEQDINDLDACGLWPMPSWMFKTGVEIHGVEVMEEFKPHKHSFKWNEREQRNVCERCGE